MFKFVIPALAAVSLASVAHASAPEKLSVTVPYGDLDLATDAGAATLHGRIAAAVKQVCARPSLRDLAAVGAWQKCRAAALDGAALQVAAARLPAQVAVR